ncbi:MAG: Fur family transcriptional regulator [Nocardioides sp.]
MKPTEEAPDVRGLLRSAGLRVTGPRVAVLGVLQAHPHSTAESVATRARRLAGPVSTQTVYDVLHACTGAGIVRKLVPAGSAARYETRVGDNHHHLVCRSCGVTVDVDCAVGAAPCLTPSNDWGFTIDEAEVVFWGQCHTCQNSPTTPRTTTTEVQA